MPVTPYRYAGAILFQAVVDEANFVVGDGCQRTAEDICAELLCRFRARGRL